MGVTFVARRLSDDTTINSPSRVFLESKVASFIILPRGFEIEIDRVLVKSNFQRHLREGDELVQAAQLLKNSLSIETHFL